MESSIHVAGDGTQVHRYQWLTESVPKALVHIAHGMGEHAARYYWTAQQLNASGHAVTAHEHRVHGPTADSL